jgi:hypothetical protein
MRARGAGETHRRGLLPERWGPRTISWTQPVEQLRTPAPDAATKAIPELESSMVQAKENWQAVGELAAARIGATIRDARRTVTRVKSEMLTARLDRLQHHAPDRSLGQDLGISL